MHGSFTSEINVESSGVVFADFTSISVNVHETWQQKILMDPNDTWVQKSTADVMAACRQAADAQNLSCYRCLAELPEDSISHMRVCPGVAYILAYPESKPQPSLALCRRCHPSCG